MNHMKWENKHSTLYNIKEIYLNLGFVILRSKKNEKEVTDVKTVNLSQGSSPYRKLYEMCS